ncbi:MAG: hypothetical protein J6W64_02415 [Bacilli bacterium]|nr:hypothetical protein [Bacilli bacterium]
MAITTGFLKYKRYIKLSNGNYQLVSHWTSSDTVQMSGSGNTLSTDLGDIRGITDSLTSTSSNIALSAAAGRELQDQLQMRIRWDTSTSATTMTNLFSSLSNGTVFYTTTERISDKPSGKYGVVVIYKTGETRTGAICICTDGTFWVNGWNPSSSTATGWIQKS